MIKIKDLKKGDRIWKTYPTQEEQEFIVSLIWRREDGSGMAEIDYADDDYFHWVDDEELAEERYYFK